MLPNLSIDPGISFARLIETLRAWAQAVTDRTLTNDRVWDDVPPAVVSVGTGVSSLTVKPYRDTPHDFSFFRHDQDDELYLQYQMPHRWAWGTQLVPHLHLIPTGAGSGRVVFTGQYAWSAVGETLPADASWTDFRVEKDIAATDQYREVVAALPTLTPPVFGRHSLHLYITIRRAGTDARDTYTASDPSGTAAANLALVSLDTHYQIDKTGTETQFGSY